ncbi:signal peptidase I [Ureibacillus chungkukjangi]|uniref:Signal peptidase I n=1 Tax=Ureibacillus chungkukjangi TaxID=1202712 RepID=A0A318THQ5_9BACL|nr:signal peptidase I [Ureibacillus chungkukjangi]MCM3387887.1 signal peptidase I [Ureibacillus chungkukjangi]PYF03447.1 signal peptidase I [Ureibacillus chungkukjangi]
MKLWTLFIVSLIMLVGCSNVSSETITDENSKPDIATIEHVTAEMITYHHMYDNMDRGNHDYSDKTLAIESNVNTTDISRGDVISFENEENDQDISRVVALPGEKVKITKGQIYINGLKLDTFYGKAHRTGLDKENYFKKMDEAGSEYNEEAKNEIFELNMEEIELSDNEYYLIGDDWFRGKRIVVTEEQIIGKVMGYTNQLN